MPGLNGFDYAASKEDRQHAKRYDAWFKSLPKVQQDKLREEGAGPYSEARTHDHVFPIYEQAAIWAYKPNDVRVEQDEFISREQVANIVNDVVQMLGYTRDPRVRRHWELMRLILRAPGHLNGKEIGEMFGVTKQAISIQAKGMLAFVDKRRQASVQAQLDAAAHTPETPPKGISFDPPRRPRGSDTPSKKRASFSRFSSVDRAPRKK
jgi:hypothetical protein